MKKKKLLVKIVFVAFVVLLLFSLVAPAIFSQARLPAPQKENLLNGLKVLMWPDAKSDKVSVRIRVHSGSAFDPQGREGVMYLLANNVFPNDAAKDYFADDLGGGLEIITTYDYIEINASAKPDGMLSMLETLSTAVANPVIDKETTGRLRDALLAKLKESEAEPGYLADQAAAKRLLGTFPYGRPLLGTPESVKNINFADLIDAKERFLTADNATIALSGNFDRPLAYRAVRRYFGGWLKSDKRVPSTFTNPEEPPASLLTIRSPKPGVAAIRFAIRGTSRSDKELSASFIFSSILETRLKARVPSIHSEDVFVRNEPHTLPGLIMIGFSADRSTVGDANGKIEANDLLFKALSDTITDAEFQIARNKVRSEWEKRDAVTAWLDADTYKLSDPNRDAASMSSATLAGVRAFQEKMTKSPVAVVLVNSPPAA
ncbi:MAG: M16 family metallopeptidase [Pyrinomonadaceae bacterium]